MAGAVQTSCTSIYTFPSMMSSVVFTWLLRPSAAELHVHRQVMPNTDVPITKLQSVVKHILKHSLGYTHDDEATIITDILMFAQLRGNSQGVIKLITGGVSPSRGADNPIEIEFETKLSARLDGHGTAGMLLMNRATEMAIAKAKEHGFGLIATHGTASGTGAIGYFGHKMACEGLIGFALSQSPEFVAPFGSYEPIFGTNPFSIGIPMPAPSKPVVLDMATSAIAWYAVKEAKTAGRPIPGDVAYDAHGHETTDPSEALAGALRVFDRSYKGSHIALMIEILAGALAGGEVEEKHKRGNWGNLVFAIDPELLGPAAEFKDKVKVLIERVKGAKRLPGVDEIHVPSERSEAKAQAALDRGTVQLEANMYEALLKAYRECGGLEGGSEAGGKGEV